MRSILPSETIFTGRPNCILGGDEELVVRLATISRRPSRGGGEPPHALLGFRIRKALPEAVVLSNGGLASVIELGHQPQDVGLDSLRGEITRDRPTFRQLTGEAAKLPRVEESARWIRLLAT